MANPIGPDFPYDNTKMQDIMDVFDGPEQECHPLQKLDTDDATVGACHALWLLNGGETSKWNGEGCDCELIQGNLNCKLNPF